jgi:hypothetical protein
MECVKSILLWQIPTALSLQDFQFKMSLAAAQHNWSSFSSFDRSLEKVIASDPNSIMAYGSEFKPPQVLAPLLASYPLWPHFQRILEHGSDPPRERLDETSRQLALEAALQRGNHKSAKMKTLCEEAKCKVQLVFILATKTRSLTHLKTFSKFSVEKECHQLEI